MTEKEFEQQTFELCGNLLVEMGYARKFKCDHLTSQYDLTWTPQGDFLKATLLMLDRKLNPNNDEVGRARLVTAIFFISHATGKTTGPHEN